MKLRSPPLHLPSLLHRWCLTSGTHGSALRWPRPTLRCVTSAHGERSGPLLHLPPAGLHCSLQRNWPVPCQLPFIAALLTLPSLAPRLLQVPPAAGWRGRAARRGCPDQPCLLLAPPGKLPCLACLRLLACCCSGQHAAGLCLVCACPFLGLLGHRCPFVCCTLDHITSNSNLQYQTLEDIPGGVEHMPPAQQVCLRI